MDFKHLYFTIRHHYRTMIKHIINNYQSSGTTAMENSWTSEPSSTTLTPLSHWQNYGKIHHAIHGNKKRTSFRLGQFQWQPLKNYQRGSDIETT